MAHDGSGRTWARYCWAALAAAWATGPLGGCGNSADDSRIGTRKWGSFDVAVEVRPGPPSAGRNEVVVIVSGERHRPVYDALVSVRTSDAQPWVQAIEDGHVGVYRRGVFFAGGASATVQVRLQRAADEAVLAFPVALAPAP